MGMVCDKVVTLPEGYVVSGIAPRRVCLGVRNSAGQRQGPW